MELKIICPLCRNVFNYSSKVCSSCDYNMSENNQNFLAFETVNAYNNSISLIQNNKYLEAWELLIEKIYFYPFIIDYFKLGFHLSILIGEYKYSFQFLNSLKGYIDIKEFDRLKEELSSQIKIYNRIIKGSDSISLDDDYTLIHLYLLYLQVDDLESQFDILHYIKNIDPNIAKKLTMDAFMNSKTHQYIIIFDKILMFLLWIIMLFPIYYLLLKMLDK